jgi:hypothetical protein
MRSDLLRAVRTAIFAATILAPAAIGASAVPETNVVPLGGSATWAELLEAQAADASEAREPSEAPLMPVWEPQEVDAWPGLVPPPPAPTAAQAQTGVGRLNAPLVPVRAFEAISLGQPGVDSSVPPDTMGAAGPAHVMTMLNAGVRIQTKAGGDLGIVALQTFFSPATESRDVFDPRLVYDSLAGRWIATADAERRSPDSEVLFAISETSDPTGRWFFYAFDADPAGLLWADFPGFGVNSTWIAITNNMFPSVGVNQGAKMWVIDKVTALGGGPITVSVFPLGFDLIGASRGIAPQPAVTFDADEPNLYILDNPNLHLMGTPILRLAQLTGTGPAPVWSPVGIGAFLVPIAYDAVPFPTIGAEQFGVPSTCDGGANDGQPCVYTTDCPGGGCRRITTADSRLLSLTVLRNGRLWYVQHGGLPSGTPDRLVVFWNQLDPLTLASGASPIVQFGALDGGPGVYHFFPSIAVNQNDDVCIGFSRSDANSFIDALETTRLGTDPPGTTRPISVIKAGEGPYELVLSSGNRWGDYSATVVDPTDDLSFWTIQEFAGQNVGGVPAGSRWGTWWALKSRTSAAAPALSPLGLLAAAAGLLVAGVLLIRHRAASARRSA